MTQACAASKNTDTPIEAPKNAAAVKSCVANHNKKLGGFESDCEALKAKVSDELSFAKVFEIKEGVPAHVCLV